MGKVILPVGKDLGAYYDEASLKPPEHPEYHVLAGKKLIRMNSEEYRVWGTPFQAVRRYSEFDFDASALARVVKELGGASAPERVVNELLGVQALVEIDIPLHEVGDLPEGLVSFLQEHRLVPIGDGLGNRQASVDAFMIGRGGTGMPLTAVSGDAYWLWANNLTYPSLWAACERLTLNRSDETPHMLGRVILTFIPHLVANVCAYLEPIRGQQWDSGNLRDDTHKGILSTFSRAFRWLSASSTQ